MRSWSLRPPYVRFGVSGVPSWTEANDRREDDENGRHVFNDDGNGAAYEDEVSVEEDDVDDATQIRARVSVWAAEAAAFGALEALRDSIG